MKIFVASDFLILVSCSKIWNVIETLKLSLYFIIYHCVQASLRMEYENIYYIYEKLFIVPVSILESFFTDKVSIVTVLFYADSKLKKSL
jgi:hypothetical protein